MAASNFRDPSRTFTPNGRPKKKPVKIVMRLASANYVRHRGDLEDLLVLERPSKRSLHSHNIGLQERMNSRPPLYLDMDGPTPCTYNTVPPSTAANSGIRINPRSKNKRDALPFPNSEVWTYNVALNDKAPTPCTYTTHGTIGRCCPTKKDAPAYTMGTRKSTLFGTGMAVAPGPSTYDSGAALDATKRHFPSHTIATFNSYSRTLSSTPGPAHYRPNYKRIQHKSPSYTFRTRVRSSTM